MHQEGEALRDQTEAVPVATLELTGSIWLSESALRRIGPIWNPVSKQFPRRLVAELGRCARKRREFRVCRGKRVGMNRD
jgi:hypothetical protein